MDLLIAEVDQVGHADLILLERLPDQRGIQVGIERLGRTTWKVEDPAVVLDQDAGGHRAQQIAVHLRDL